MAKRKIVRKKATAAMRRRGEAAIAEEERYEQQTKQQVRELLQAMNQARAAVDDLRAERERQGLTLADASKRTGMTPATLNKLELHHTKNPTLSTLVRYAQSLGLQLDVRIRRPRKSS